MNKSEIDHQKEKIVVISQTSVVEVVIPLPEDEKFDIATTQRFGTKGRFNPKQVRKTLLNLEKGIDKLQAIPSNYPPKNSSSVYSKLNSKFLARISSRRYRENDRLKTYAVDLGVMKKKIYLFLIAEQVDVKKKRKTIRLVPLSSISKAPNEWLEGISPSILKSLSKE